MAQPGTAPHVPTLAQLSNLAALQKAQASANATLVTAQNSVNTAQLALDAATKALVEYRHWSYGGGNKANILDEGLQPTGPHVPTSAQNTQIAALAATEASAQATLASANSTLATAQLAKTAADLAYEGYQSYIYGGSSKVGPTLDEGTSDIA